GAFGETHRVWKNAGVGGVLSSYVIPGSPLSYAGIPEGAIITTVNDASVSCVADLQAELEKYVPETIVRLAGYRLRDKSKLHDLAAYEQDEWYCQLGVRPEHPARILYKYDLSYRAFLPLFGMRLARTGTRNTYRVESLVPGNFADEHGFSTYDVIEIQNIYMIEASEAIVADVYAKRRKAGYIDTFMRLVAALDNPSFF
ncbi:PDZ domain-containing protein, partial [Treponema pallidum]